MEDQEYGAEALAAISRIQYNYRTFRARRLMKLKIRQTYMKIYDKINGEYLYKNKFTGVISNKKPAFLGNEDLPDPKLYNAPLSYDPEDIEEDAFALLVTVTQFNNDRIPEMPVQLVKDHNILDSLLPHGFICKFKEEKYISLLNPTCSEFRDAFSQLKKMASRSSFLFVYICTHVATVWGGEGRNSKFDKNETAYLCMTDTIWKDSRSVAATSIPISNLIQMLNEIPSERKTVAMNYAHQPYRKPSVFGSKVMYPPGDMLSRLADGANCAVIGCCTIGTPSSDMIRHCPVLKGRLEAHADAYKRSKAERAQLEHGHEEDGDYEEHKEDDHELIHHTEGGPFTSLVDELKIEWKVPREAEVQERQPPQRPVPTYERQNTGEYSVTMPTDAEYKDYEKALFRWKIMHTLEKPVLFLRKQIKSYQKAVSIAPNQVSHIGLSYSLFGEALKLAIGGGVSSTESQHCSVLSVFKFMQKFMTEKASELESRRYEEEMRKFRGETVDPFASVVVEDKDNNDEGTAVSVPVGDESSVVGGSNAGKKRKKPKKKKDKKKAALQLKEPEPQAIAQTPVLFLPKKMIETAAQFPVCFRCGPPAEPEKPFIKRCGDTDVALEWYDPPFDGVPPTHYKIQLRNNTRNFKKWTEVQNSDPITATMFIIRNLPMGVPVQFRVIAYNNVGPSKPSSETIMVTPGESKVVPLSKFTRWHRLAYGGVLSILDHMNTCLKDRHEQIIGLSKLIAYAQRENGYPKGKTRQHVAELGMKLLGTFSDDPDVIPLVFETLGYTIRNSESDSVREYCIQHGLVDIITETSEKYRRYERVVSSIIWLCRRLPRDLVPELPPNPTSEEEVLDNTDDMYDSGDEKEEAP